jgi:hypothetical protein
VKTVSRPLRHFETDPRAELLSGTPYDPGFADLRAFSRAHEALLKELMGGFFATYFQRGNWRLVLPFLPSQQRATARELLGQIERGRPPIVHVVTFPRIDINHALLLFEAEETPLGLRFGAYDPNQPGHPVSLVFDRSRAGFLFPQTPLRWWFRQGLRNLPRLPLLEFKAARAEGREPVRR